MTLLNYTDPIPTPTPVTSGTTTQTWMDPTGEWWVAKNGVAGGAWKRAREVCYARVYRSAALTLTTTLTDIVYDAVHKDDYGLFDGTSTFQPFFNGWWEMTASLGMTPSAASQQLQQRIMIAATSTDMQQALSANVQPITLLNRVMWPVTN